MVRVSNAARKGYQGVANLFLPINHSGEESLQRVPEIFYPLLLEPRKFCLNDSGGLVKLLLGVQHLPLSLGGVSDMSGVSCGIAADVSNCTQRMTASSSLCPSPLVILLRPP